MINKNMLLAFVIASICCFTNATNYAPVNTLNLNQYLGRWYQVYKDLPDDAFEGKASCIIADYSLQNNYYYFVSIFILVFILKKTQKKRRP